jgi:hypothetical protein
MMDDTLFLFLALADDIRLSSYNICFISSAVPQCQSETFRKVFFQRVHDQGLPHADVRAPKKHLRTLNYLAG